MRLQHLTLRNFGPFRDYSLPFDLPEGASLLLTGKNNEGKSHILFALRLVDAGLRVLGKRRFLVNFDGVSGYGLLQQDIGDLTVGRLVYNYGDEVGTITAKFRGGFQLTVSVDPTNDSIYVWSSGRVPQNPQQLFGFMPPLGQLASNEDRLSEAHLGASIDTTLAPRHFRNHLLQTLDESERLMVQEIVRESWPGIEFHGTTMDWETGRINAFYSENRIEREVSWAGQGLQVWFQIVAHLVRLRSRDLLVLDEPEINLHAEKQHDLIRMLRTYHKGAILIATHSVELMNDVGVSHIIHVRKAASAASVKSTEDRSHLELIRSSIGSNFNLIASQFEAVDVVLFTEDRFDFGIVRSLAERMGFKQRVFPIPLHGFSEFPKAASYRDAYRLLIGSKQTKFSMLLDRDYYPPTYLEEVRSSLAEKGIRVVYTLEKELENLFLAPPVVRHLLGADLAADWDEAWDQFCEGQRVEAIGSGVTLYSTFHRPKVDVKSIMKLVHARLDEVWKTPRRYAEVPGKLGLAELRRFYRDRTGKNLSDTLLIGAVVAVRRSEIEAQIKELVQP